MKSLMAMLVLVVAVPAMATVNFTAVDAGSGKLTIAYTTTDGDLPRGVALRLALSDAAVVDLAAVPVAVVDPAFNAFIDYAYSNPQNFAVGNGHPLAKATEAGALAADASDFSLCAGVLDQNGGQAAGPASTTNLFTIQLKSIPVAGTNVTISGDTLRGPASGVVGSVLNSNLPITVKVMPPVGPDECVKTTATFYADWISFGKPDCWCFKRQCRGDVNGIKELIGVAQIGATDLNIFKGAFGKAAASLPAGGICADLNHAKELIGVARVGATDLAQFKLYYGKSEAQIPECPMTDYNFWIK